MWFKKINHLFFWHLPVVNKVFYMDTLLCHIHYYNNTLLHPLKCLSLVLSVCLFSKLSTTQSTSTSLLFWLENEILVDRVRKTCLSTRFRWWQQKLVFDLMCGRLYHPLEAKKGVRFDLCVVRGQGAITQNCHFLLRNNSALYSK